MKTGKKRLVWLGLALILLLLFVNLVSNHRAAARLDEAARLLEAEVPSLSLTSYEYFGEVPDSQNAARWVQAGAGLIDHSKEFAESTAYALQDWSTEPDAATLSVWRKNVEAHRLQLDLIARGIDATDSSFELYYSMGPRMVIPNVSQILYAGWMLLADARLAALEGDLERAGRAVDGLRVITFALAHESPAVMRIIGYQVEALYAAGVKVLLAAGPTDPQLLRRHAGPIEPDHKERLHSMIGFEAASLRATLSVVDSGRPVERLLGQVIKAPIYGVARQNYDYCRGVLRAGRGTVADLAAGRLDDDLAKPKSRLPWLPNLLPNFHTTVLRARTAEARSQLRRLALELRLHALEHGGYPENLEAFAAVDNPVTGEAVTYHRTADGGARLEIEGGAELVAKARRHLGAGGQVEEPSFAWHLPRLHHQAGSDHE